MKRLALKLVLFLLIGAIVNVAVAWGCACSANRRHVLAIHIDDAPFDWQRYITPESTSGIVTDLWAGFGIDEVDVLTIKSHKMTELQLENAVLALNADTWYGDHPVSGVDQSEIRRLTHQVLDQVFGLVVVRQIVAGQPMSSMRGATVFSARTSPVTEMRSQHAIALPHGTFDLRLLPLHPIWPGFAINTIFYAAVLWVLLLILGSVKRLRRRRRGQCIHCGYDLRGKPADSDKCPECGRGCRRQHAAGAAGASTAHASAG